MAENESDRTQEPPQKALLEISTAKLKAESSSASNMVFPHSKYPCGEGSTLHLSATERKSGLNCFDGRFKGKLNPGLAMKRPYSGDDIHSLPGEKRNCLESLRFVKEEISQADFQMALIKRSIAKRKEWIYRQVLQNLGLASPYDSNHSQQENIGHNRVNETREQCQQLKTQTRGYSNTNTTAGSQERSVPLVQQGRVDDQVKRPRSAPHSSCSGFSSDHRSKVHDEDGNCYIDEDDFRSFYRPKGSPLPSPIGNIPNGETRDFNTCDTTSVPKRSLNFTFHGSNGGLAIDHTRMPRITAIHSVGGIKGRRREHEAHLRKHAEAKLTGSTYSETIKRDETGRQKIITKEETKWWPPSPESMPEDVMSRDGGEGLLKVMTPDDLEAYGLSKQDMDSEVAAKEPEDDDVIVTHVKLAPNDKKNVSSKSAMGPKLVSELPALQLDAYGKPSNYKEILLHFISERTSTSLANIQSVAERPRRKLNMDQLCNKLLYTRQRLEREQQKCKRKLLSSLEVVLIKKIRRLEQETGESAPAGIVLEGSVRDTQKEVTEEENVAVSSKGSNSDIVAMMEDLTAESGDDERARCHRRVSTIRGYDSS